MVEVRIPLGTKEAGLSVRIFTIVNSFSPGYNMAGEGQKHTRLANAEKSVARFTCVLQQSESIIFYNR